MLNMQHNVIQIKQQLAMLNPCNEFCSFATVKAPSTQIPSLIKIATIFAIMLTLIVFVPPFESSKEEQDSSVNDEEEEKEKETPAGSGKPLVSNLNLDVPAVESVDKPSDVPAVESVPEEESREIIARKIDEAFKKAMGPISGAVENTKKFAATRTVVSLWSAVVMALYTPSDLDENDLKDTLLLSELNRQTLDTLDSQAEKAERFRELLQEKKKALEEERDLMNQRITKKLNWIIQKRTEIQAEENSLEKMIRYHENIDKYVSQALNELRRIQKSPEAEAIQWAGLGYDFTKEGGEKLQQLSFYEKMFSEKMMTNEVTAEKEMDTALRQFDVVDLEAAPAQGAGSSANFMSPPEIPIKREPKMKPMPKPLHKEDEREKEKKREEKLLQEKKRKEEEDAASSKRAKSEDPSKRLKELVASDHVPTDHLEVKISPQCWKLMGWSSREKILVEKAAEGQRCFFCNNPGHRAFACEEMLRLGLAWGQTTGCMRYGGNDRRYSLLCSSCGYANFRAAVEKGEDPKKTSGWFGHTRSACHNRSTCPLDSDDLLVKMSAAELYRHLRLKGMYGREEQDKQERERLKEWEKEKGQKRDQLQ